MAGVVVREVVTAADLALCHRLRCEVFCDEQGVSREEELDALDPVCRHFLAWLGGEPVGTARLLDLGAGRVKVQRVAVLAGHRRRGIGRALMLAAESAAAAQGVGELLLGAQETALAFYQSLGYTVEGEPFLDAGIPHRTMRKRL